MPIRIPDALPARNILVQEEVAVIDESTATRQDIRPLRILLLNLMPDKITTETQFARVLGATPLQIELTLLRTDSYMGKNTAEDHLLGFYSTHDNIKDQCFDGMIVTGAPVEQMPFTDVEYWLELTKIFNWSQQHVYSSLHICWGAQAALFHFHGHEKFATPQKQFGVFPHTRLDLNHPLTKGFDDIASIPVSRHTSMNDNQLRDNPNLKILLDSPDTGIGLLVDDDLRHIYMFNHLEYDRETLGNEYRRDISKGMKIQVPAHYFNHDDPSVTPVMTWRAHRNLLFGNWINMVYQGTPYNIDEIKKNRQIDISHSLI
jgi:homoserine O-succinyltransferase/O-acetyltransferase